MRRRWLLILAVVAALALVALGVFLASRPAPAPPPAPAPVEEELPPGVAFIDRFRTLDQERWQVSDRVRDGSWIENDYRRRQLGLGPNGLAISLDTSAGEAKFTSGEIQSKDSFTYGYFEARMRVPRGEGLITGLFTWVGPDGPSRHQELDIEILGRATRRLYASYHYGGGSVERIVELPFDAADGFHTYAIEWTPQAIRWYVDNRLVHEDTSARARSIVRPQRFIVNLWATEELYRWAGRIDPVDAPWRLEVACVARAERYLGRALC